MSMQCLSGRNIKRFVLINLTINSDFKGDENVWVKWTQFSIGGSFLCHIPIIQPIVHFTYFTELRNLDNQLAENQQNYIEFRDKVNKKRNDKTLDEEQEEAYNFGRTNSQHLNAKKTLLATFLELKLLEAFLEAGPQFVFQLSVMMQDGVSSYNQIITICTSAFSLIWASAELFLKHPTEVRKSTINEYKM